MKKFWSVASVAMALCSALLPFSAAHSQTYPNRPIVLVVPFAPGGGADAAARKIAEPLSKRLGQPIVIENRAGAGGVTGASHVARSAPDGYTLLWTTPGQQMTLPHMTKMPYDALTAFAPVSQALYAAGILVVHRDLPVNSVAELIAYAKAHPGEISFASAGVGASSHLAGELFKSEAGIDIVHVPYKGTGPAVIDVASGRVKMAIDSLSVYQPQLAAGTVRALGVASVERNPGMPELPPIADTLAGFEAAPVNYFLAPANTPKPVIDKLNTEINAVLADPELQAWFIKSGGIVLKGGTPEQLDALIRDESAKWKKVIERSGAKAE